MTQKRTREKEPRSLFGQLLDWMMVPLLIVWPLAVLFTYVAARTIADGPYDRDLVSVATALTHVVPAEPLATADPSLLLPPQAREILGFDNTDDVHYQVSLLDGRILFGDGALAPLEGQERNVTGTVELKDGDVGDDPIRIAYVVFQPSGWDQAVAIQVGETLRKRERLAGEITRMAVIILALLLVCLVALVLFGLRRGLEPLNRLRDRVLARGPDDLSPIPLDDTPVEVAPLVATVNHQVARVARSVDAQRRFIADAAHQMKTPLAGLKMQAELAQRAAGESDLRERMAQIEDGADRAHHLVQRLLALARADGALAARSPGERVDLNEVARTACEALAPTALSREIDFGFEAYPGEAAIQGDALLLGELVTNLAENAIKYSRRGGQVTVRIVAGPVLEIEDSGPGIAVEDRDRIFERFYRVPGSGATGAGLGLPIVRAIAEQHGATIAVDPGPGGAGSRFRVSGWRQVRNAIW